MKPPKVASAKGKSWALVSNYDDGVRQEVRARATVARSENGQQHMGSEQTSVEERLTLALAAPRLEHS